MWLFASLMPYLSDIYCIDIPYAGIIEFSHSV